MTQRIQDAAASSPPTATGAPCDVDSRQFKATISTTAGGVRRLTLSGDIDLAVRDQLRQIIEARLVGEGVKALLIDMAAVTFLDCGGIGALITGRHLAADIGCEYRVVNARGIVARVLDLAGVWPVLQLSLIGAEVVVAAGSPRRPLRNCGLKPGC